MLGDAASRSSTPARIPVAEQIRMFAEAESIVGPHGAALTNLLFASPGASVIELFAPDYVEGSYWKLVDCVPGVSTATCWGPGRRPAPAGRRSRVMSDITVDLAALTRALDSLPNR